MARDGLRLDPRELERFKRRLGKKFAEVSERAVADGLNLLEARSVELAPVRTGNLEQSWAEQVKRSSRSVVGTFGFGAPYAAEVHELPPDARGPRTRRKPSGKYGEAGPRYLLRAMRGVVGDGSLARRLADRYRRSIRGG